MAIELDVTYRGGEPVKIEYFSMVYGLMKFDMVGSTAVVDNEWDEITAKNLAEGFEQKIFTEDVIGEVEQLPFVQAVEYDE